MSTLHTQPAITIALVVAYIQYWLWKILMTIILGILYVSLIAEGSRMLMPAMAQKLYKLAIPGFAMLGEYQETRRLDLAMPFAFIVFLVASNCWELILLVLLSTDEAFKESGWKVENYKRLILILGSVFLFADCVLFYKSMSQMEWGSTRFSFSALMGTAVYIVILIFVSLISVNLRKALKSR